MGFGETWIRMGQKEHTSTIMSFRERAHRTACESVFASDKGGALSF